MTRHHHLLFLLLLLCATWAPLGLSAQEGGQSTEDSAIAPSTDSSSSERDRRTDDRSAGEKLRRRFDSTFVRPLVIARTSVDRYRQLDEFDYDRVRDPRSLWDRMVQWALGWLRDLLPSSVVAFFDDFLSTWLPWILILSAAVLTGFKLYRTRLGGVLGRSDIGVSSAMMRVEEDLGGIDLDRAADAAVGAGRYRLAIRYLYLATLRDLAGRGLIDFKPERTNRDYLRDLAPSPFGAGFEQVMLLFEYVWYGERPVDSGDFASMRRSYTAFRSEVQGRVE